MRGRPGRLLASGGRLVRRCPSTAALVTNALGMAIQSRKPTVGTLIHADQGGQFTSWAFSQRAKASGLGAFNGRGRRLL